MNLGGLIGELRLKLDEANERAPVAKPKVVVAPKPRTGTAASIRRVLADHPEGLTFRSIVELAGIDYRLVGGTLSMMRDIEKAGQRGDYVYTLARRPGS